VDVGNGLCVVGREPGGRSFLYDAGYSGDHCGDAVREIVGSGPIDIVILSHSDSDHISDAKEILERHGAGTVIHPGDARDGQMLGVLRGALERLARRGTRVISLAASPLSPGTTFPLGAATLTFVAGWSDGRLTAAPGDPYFPASDQRNALSIVMRLEHGGHSVLLTGDTIGRRRGENNSACRNAERIMSQSSVSIDSDILIGQHHGGDNATSNCFIRAVSPEWVIFSAGRGHGHPAQRVADRLVANSISPDKILRTDRGDNEGHGEWLYGSIKGCTDRAGDDDIEILLPRAGDGLRVAYRRVSSEC
jgi:beta-lactamase superfamily II metal-dependent hydrolase